MKLAIEKIVYGGAGLAHNGQETVFVPFTLPGEIVDADVSVAHAGFSEATLSNIIKAAPERVASRCDHFEHCGGCQYQHGAYEEQLRIKQAILKETLERAGLEALPEIAVHADQPWEYRNRIRLRVAVEDDALRVGYLRRASAEFLPVRMCPIAAPSLWQAAEAFLALDKGFPQWTRVTEEIEFFTSHNEEKMQMTLFVRTQPHKGFVELCEALQQKMPALAGAGVQVMESAGRNRKSLKVKPGATWGAAGLNYTVADETHWVSRGSFFQVNRGIVSKLVELATEGRSGRLAWDLYAGVGLFSRVLAKQFGTVVAVEAVKGDLAVNLRGEGRHAVAATTVEFLRRAVLERDRPDLIVMDPPRAGVGAEVCSLLARIKAPEIIYVSCDPTTLGRDLRAMIDSGYSLHQLHMVDMFPQTFHQETVVILKR